MLSGFAATIWLFGQINLDFGHVLLFATDHFVVQVIQLVFCFVCVCLDAAFRGCKRL